MIKKLTLNIRPDTPTDFGHIYPRSLLYRELDRLVLDQALGITGSIARGESTPPSTRITHRLVAYSKSSSGIVEVIVDTLDTPAGKDLAKVPDYMLLATTRGSAPATLDPASGYYKVEEPLRLSAVDVFPVPQLRPHGRISFGC